MPGQRQRRDTRRPDAARRRRSRLSRIESSRSHRRAAHRRIAWYAGLTLMALFDLVDWPVALVIAVGHELAHRARTEAMRELAEGIQAGA